MKKDEIKEKIKEFINNKKSTVKLKELIRSKKGIALIGGITLLIVLIVIMVSIKDTHAYYNSATDPIPIFTSKVGNFKPRIDTFYIKEITMPKYTNVQTNIVYLIPGANNKNIDGVCITETNDINDCNDKWQAIQPSNQYSYTFRETNIEGIKTIFGFIKDRYGNKSVAMTDAITYDVTPPTVTYSLPEGTYTGDQILTITPSDNLSGVGLWAVRAYKDNVFDEAQSSWDLTGRENYTITLTEGSTWIVYAQVYDRAGNLITQQPNNGGGWYYQNYTIKPKSAKGYLEKYDPNNTLQDTAVDGLYRYYGEYTQVTNNYICFGTTDPTKCGQNVSQEDNRTYLYRIIGIQAEDDNTIGLKQGQLKLIKAYPSSLSQQWHYTPRLVTWDESDMVTYLNGTGSNQFLGTITGEIATGVTWQSLISNPKWYIGDYKYDSYESGNKQENKSLVSANHKIGLVYASDYYNSWTYRIPGSTTPTNWLQIAYGMTGNPSLVEDTMTRYGRAAGGDLQVWVISNNIFQYSPMWVTGLDGWSPVRPVFYLIYNITLTGEGTEQNPFLISVA